MPVPLRTDFDASQLRASARETKDGPAGAAAVVIGRLYDGASRTEAAKIGGVTLQIVRDWVIKFNAHGPSGLIDRKAPGQPPRLSDTHRAALASVIESGPIPAVHGVVRWRIIDLCQWLWFRQNSGHAVVPVVALPKHNGHRMGERDRWSASHAAGQQSRSGLSARRIGLQAISLSRLRQAVQRAKRWAAEPDSVSIRRHRARGVLAVAL
jgi:Homeodomain-like domain